MFGLCYDLKVRDFIQKFLCEITFLVFIFVCKENKKAIITRNNDPKIIFQVTKDINLNELTLCLILKIPKTTNSI